jgi:hypothetical protein
MSKINSGRFLLTVAFSFLAVNFCLTFFVYASFSVLKFSYFWLKTCQPGMTKEDVLKEVPNLVCKSRYKKGDVVKKGLLYSNANDVKVAGEILSCNPSMDLFSKKTDEESILNIFASLSGGWIVVNESGIIQTVYWVY